MIDYELTQTTDEVINREAIKTGLDRAAKKLGLQNNRLVQIEVVDLEASRHLNKALRNTNEPTDCISISTQESHVGEQAISDTAGALELKLNQTKEIEHQWPVMGQLVICLEVVKRNATQACQPLERELEWVVEHGVLHLMGFHHDHDA